MSVHSKPRPEMVFVVRMWLQGESDSNDASWRGSVQEVDSGKRRYVADSHEVVDFIDSHLVHRENGCKPGFS